MKRETKELVNWIKSVIEGLEPEYTRPLCQSEYELNEEAKRELKLRKIAAVKFLDSLPDIEKHLCRGGYIQDENGIPCCEGDVIEYKDLQIDEIVKGTLYWSVNDKRFYSKRDDTLYLISTYFKKVDK